MREQDVIFDWDAEAAPPRVELHDETMRDGIQSPSIFDPPIEAKMAALRLLDAVGVASSDLGLPGAGPRAVEDVTRLVEVIRDEKLSIRPTCAARTHANDIRPIVEISERTGVPIEAMMFLGTSPIRLYAEGWDVDRLEELTRGAVKMAHEGGIPATFVTEDTIRSHPDTLERLFTAAVEEGAGCLILCDTVGAATPQGVRHLVRWTDGLLRRLGVRDRVTIDWHGHEDRGLSLVNTLAAIEAGADRAHGCILGIGERVGNTSLDLLLVNLKLQGLDHDLTRLAELVDLVSDEWKRPIPVDYPVFGRDAFRTGTGVHAAAVIKAQKKGETWLADRIYSGVPASWVGRRQEIDIGPMSGMSNVRFWLEAHGLPADDALVEKVFAAAKASPSMLEESEIRAIVAAHAA